MGNGLHLATARPSKTLPTLHLPQLTLNLGAIFQQNHKIAEFINFASPTICKSRHRKNKHKRKNINFTLRVFVFMISWKELYWNTSIRLGFESGCKMHAFCQKTMMCIVCLSIEIVSMIIPFTDNYWNSCYGHNWCSSVLHARASSNSINWDLIFILYNCYLFNLLTFRLQIF